jgi:chromosome segregation ATPase
MTVPTESYDESIKDAVARETARRKRVFLGFMGLLLIPIAIGAYVLSQAPSEIEKVASDVAPIVTQQVGGEISSRVTQEVVSRVEPRIASETGVLKREIATLQKTAQDTSAFIAAAQPRLTSLSARVNGLSSGQVSPRQLAELRQAMTRDLDSVRAMATRTEQITSSHRETVGSLSRRVEGVERELKALQDRLAALEKRLGTSR